jgi:hypothetical protein
MSGLPDIGKFAAADFRYHLTVLSGFVLGLLLLFINHLPGLVREVMLPALAVYTIGTALIGYVQTLLTVSANTKAQAAGKTPEGIGKRHLWILIGVHVVWFVLLIVFLVLRGVAQETV